MSKVTWKAAILRVLEESEEPLHYADIAQTIIDKKYRDSVGATPAATVAATISMDLKDVLVRPKPGFYALASSGAPTAGAVKTPPSKPLTEVEQAHQEMGLINAFGMFWRREEVDWAPIGVRLYGVQQAGSQRVDFGKQAGVYLLYDRTRVVYVGRVQAPGLGKRLRDHTKDRLSARWDRFSWFGVRRVGADGRLGEMPTSDIGVDTLIATMEALLIEGLEPPQNRRQGDGFVALEFIQETDPSVTSKQQKKMLLELMSRD